MHFPRSTTRLSACAALLAGMFALPALTAAQTLLPSDMIVRITIAGNCSVQTITPLDFFSQATLQNNVDQAASIPVNCTTGMPYQVGFDLGDNPAGTQRRMKMGTGTATINYEIYKEQARTTALGAAWGTSNTIAATGTGAVQTHTVYGRVPGSQTAAAGNYQDTVTVTVRY